MQQQQLQKQLLTQTLLMQQQVGSLRVRGVDLLVAFLEMLQFFLSCKGCSAIGWRSLGLRKSRELPGFPVSALDIQPRGAWAPPTMCASGGFYTVGEVVLILALACVPASLVLSLNPLSAAHT